jgi:alpha-N-arabinofuranosidase
LVNVIGAIMTEPGGMAWRQTIFHPFAQAARFAHGKVLRANVQTDSYATAAYPKVDYLLSSVLHDEASGRMAVFALNRSSSEPMRLTVDLPDLGACQLIAASELHHTDLKAENSRAKPGAVQPMDHPACALQGNQLQATLRPLSWNVFVTEAG